MCIVIFISDQTKLIDMEEMAKTVAKGKWATDASDVSIILSKHMRLYVCYSLTCIFSTKYCLIVDRISLTHSSSFAPVSGA